MSENKGFHVHEKRNKYNVMFSSNNADVASKNGHGRIFFSYIAGILLRKVSL